MDNSPTSLLTDMVRMKEVIVLNDEPKKEIRNLNDMLQKPLPLVRTTARTIALNHIPRYVLANLAVPLLIIYAALTVKTTNELIQLTFVIFATFQCVMAVNFISLMEARLDEYHAAARSLARVIDTSGLGFVFARAGESDHPPPENESTESEEVIGASPSKKHAIELRNITVQYFHRAHGNVTVLQNLSLSIAHNAKVALIGESVSSCQCFIGSQ